MKFCSHCGNQLNDAMLFCPTCGNKVNIILAKEKNSTHKKRSLGVFSIFASLFPFLMFFIPLQITYDSIWSENHHLIINGYDTFLKLDMLSIWWGRGSNIISIVNVGILSISLTFLLLNIFNTIKGTCDKTLYNISAFLCVFFSLLYCIEGIILVVLCHPTYEPITFAYFALILACCIAAIPKLFVSNAQ